MVHALRVGSLPHEHPYVDAVLAEADVVRVPPTGGPGLAGAVADPAEVDVLLLHFGYEGHPHAELRDLLVRAERHGTPVVAFVHDLENPHLLSQDRHRADLDAVVGAAALVVTLSHHAADAVAQRWGRPALVLPHPALVPPGHVVPARTPGPPRVGLHAKSLRTNLLVRPAVGAMAALVRERPGLSATVWMHADVGARAHDLLPALVAAEDDGVAVVRHGRLDDTALRERLQDLDVLLLPYRHGTHSGLLELARDLGTATVAPRTGAYAEQGATATFDPAARDVEGSLLGALGRALADGPPPPADAAARTAATRADSRRLGAALRGTVPAASGGAGTSRVRVGAGA